MALWAWIDDTMALWALLYNDQRQMVQWLNGLIVQWLHRSWEGIVTKNGQCVTTLVQINSIHHFHSPERQTKDPLCFQQKQHTHSLSDDPE